MHNPSLPFSFVYRKARRKRSLIESPLSPFSGLSFFPYLFFESLYTFEEGLLFRRLRVVLTGFSGRSLDRGFMFSNLVGNAKQ